MKSFKHFKHLPLKQFPLMDLRFLRRELELENIKSQLYNIVDLSNKKFDENKIYLSLVNAFRSISQNGHIKGRSDSGF